MTALLHSHVHGLDTGSSVAQGLPVPSRTSPGCLPRAGMHAAVASFLWTALWEAALELSFCRPHSRRLPVFAGIEGAAARETHPSSRTQALPVSSTPAPAEINFLDRDIQGVLRKGTYDFARCSG